MPLYRAGLYFERKQNKKSKQDNLIVILVLKEKNIEHKNNKINSSL